MLRSNKFGNGLDIFTYSHATCLGLVPRGGILVSAHKLDCAVAGAPIFTC